jgi:hypothetical protein
MPTPADLVFTAHFFVVAFIVGGLLVIWTGAAFRWRWVHYMWFRAIHLAAIGFVALQTPLGQACPLTIWEDALRGHATQTGFIERWVNRLLYFDLPAWAFTAMHLGFALLVLVTWWWVPPRGRARDAHTRETRD